MKSLYEQKIMLSTGAYKECEEYWTAYIQKSFLNNCIAPFKSCRSMLGQERKFLDIKKELSIQDTEWIKRGTNDADFGIKLLFGSLLLCLAAVYNGERLAYVGVGAEKGNEHTDHYPVKYEIKRNQPFIELLGEVKEQAVNSLNYANCPLDAILNKLYAPELWGGYNLFFDLYDHYVERQVLDADLIFLYERTNESGMLRLKYNEQIYSREECESILSGLIAALRSIETNINIPICDLSFLSCDEKERVLHQFNKNIQPLPGKGFIEMFKETVCKYPEHIAIEEQGKSMTYAALDSESDRLAGLIRRIYEENGLRDVVILLENSILQFIAVLSVIKAGLVYIPLDSELPLERIQHIIKDSNAGLLISSKRHVGTMNRLQWMCDSLRYIFCMDSHNLCEENEADNRLMNKQLWEYVGERAYDEVSGGGWKNSYSGEDLSAAEMNEYGDNALQKLKPYLCDSSKVLEIGCASGITMFRIAPFVGKYYGIDLSESILKKNQAYIKEKKIQNIVLKYCRADQLKQLEEDSFDIIILNSVIQCFNGYNYLKQVIKDIIEAANDKALIFLGDLMDLDLREELIADFRGYASLHNDKNTKTDWSEELFISRAFLEELQAEFPAIAEVEFSSKIHTIENELTRFRYDALIHINKDGRSTRKKTRLQLAMGNLNNVTETGLDVAYHPNQSVYKVYTSGTTGKPKGVMISHGGLEHLCLKTVEMFKFDCSSTMTRYASFGFDAAVWEMLPPLTAGTKINIIPRDIRYDMEQLATYMEANGITHTFLPTQIYEKFMRYSPTGLKCVLTGGDKLTKFRPADYTVYNNYGPAEMTVFVTTYELEKNLPRIPIGKPIADTRIYIVDEEGNLLPTGAKGEICCAGHGIALGYANDKELTERKFSILRETGEKIYRTGDLGRVLLDGNILFEGRADNQVKIRGNRIEIEEVELALLKNPYIKEVVVDVRNDHAGDKILCAWYTSEYKMDKEYLDNFLLKNIPVYMLPQYYVKLNEIPLNQNGKYHKSVLTIPDYLDKKEKKEFPATNLEKEVAQIWENVLGITPIGLDDNFFDLGGNSLKSVNLITDLKGVLTIDLADIFQHPTIREMTQIEETRRAG
ncbi:AMP-binding protein [Clostridium aminobutyricum]|uniref:AMP-binding protein n=1 Tax=Clostridium aminobutyricum TaxID=33953 RepID=A0A939IHL5_CLOAM|nr:AMP-binding protein [Clostridium aminobutyricum]MBN7773937.1 AMP-binding protein [Clostridium aminobutyricum]